MNVIMKMFNKKFKIQSKKIKTSIYAQRITNPKVCICYQHKTNIIIQKKK